ncbi:MAG: acyl-CoA thioesterase [Myxococcota bacterium]
MPTTWPVAVRFPVHWGEMDALGHVNNTRYFAWFETARIALFARVGVVMGDVGPILASASCDFVRPVKWPAAICVGARVPRLGNTSYTIEYEAFADDVVCARGTSVVVQIDYRTGEKVPIVDPLRAALAALGA